MSRFAKIMAALAIILVISVFFFLGSVFALFGRLAANTDGFKERRAHITELRLEGPIMSSDTYMESIQRISEDKSCKGILLRIDSPGGAVGASQEIHSALKTLKAKGLPIVVSQGNLAASGGYYVSLAGDRIFSNAGTLTGSIGVILQFPEAEKLMEKVGIKMNTIKSGALKDVGNFARPPTPEEIRYLQTVIDNTYGQFISDILASRKIERSELMKIADGRILTGSQAKAYGLVDTLGGYQEAKHYLAGLVKLEGEPIVVREPPSKSWIENALASKTSSSFGPLAEAARDWLPSVRQGTYFIWK
ncbi:MAG: signal peptide peptidase Serine peptidase family [Fibrobacteres bacterium]|nr:signal peptide peptidase Serine peptidase family [Fibrobacterota bacterium]